MSQPIPAIDETEFPPVLWRRSGRPLRGQFVRGYVVVTAIVGAILFLAPPTSWIVSGVVLVSGLALPYVVELYLARWEQRVRAADKHQANAVLEQLRANRWIRNLAPHGWVALQEGILQMHRRDGRAAAKCFEQALRLAAKAPDASPLISAQAHALVLAGDRKPARELLEGLAEPTRTTRDHLDLGLLLLQESGSNREALDHLEKAHEDLGDHPRVLAGLALAERKVGAEDQAYAHYVAADEALRDADDPLAADVLKRARKALRARIKEEQKKARAEATPSPDEDDSQAASAARSSDGERKGKRKKDKRKRKKDKKEKKRDKKRDKKRERKREKKRAEQPPPSPPAKPATPSKAPLFGPPGAAKPATPSPLFAPPKRRADGSLPPPPVVPPPPKLGAPPKVGGLPKLGGPPKLGAPTKASPPKAPAPAISDDGWGDALGDQAPPPAPVAPTKPETKK